MYISTIDSYLHFQLFRDIYLRLLQAAINNILITEREYAGGSRKKNKKK